MNNIFKQGLGNSVTALVTAFIATFALTILDFVLIFATIFKVSVNTKPNPMSPTILIPILIIIALNLVIGVGVQAGLYGSYKDAVEGQKITISQYFNNCKKYFWTYLGYSFWYGFLLIATLVPFIIIAVLLIIIFAGTKNDAAVGIMILGEFVAMFSYILYFCPKMTLSIVGLNKKGFVKRHMKPLTLIALISATLLFIPGANIVISLGQMIFPLYILSLYYEDNASIDKLNSIDFQE